MTDLQKLRYAAAHEMPHPLHRALEGEPAEFVLTNEPARPAGGNLLDAVGNEVADIEGPDAFDREEDVYGPLLAGPALLAAGALAAALAFVPPLRTAALAVAFLALPTGAGLTWLLAKKRRSPRRHHHWYAGTPTRLLHLTRGRVRALPWSEVARVTHSEDQDGTGRVTLHRAGGGPVVLGRLRQPRALAERIEARRAAMTGAPR